MSHPYERQPPSAFWSRAARDSELSDIWAPKAAIDGRIDTFISAGSCFSNHIGRVLLELGFTWLSDDGASQHPGGYASFDLGNVYTARQLLFWLDAAVRPAQVPLDAGIFADPASGVVTDLLRLGIAKPEFASVEDLVAALRRACDAIRTLLGKVTVFFFTLGLTEGWETPEGTPYPICPAVKVAGLDPASYRFVNYGHDEIWRDVERIVALLAALNPGLRLILTVSPVPLTATATDRHVVPATVYSKSVLRAVAERAAQRLRQVDYFPSYELITTHIHGRDFFEADRRQVKRDGVDFVMRHFLAGMNRGPLAEKPTDAALSVAVNDAHRVQPRDTGVRRTTTGLLAGAGDVCEEELYDVDMRGIPAGAPKILFLGSSQVREISKELGVPHRIFTMNGIDFARSEFEEGPDIIFRPKAGVFREKWQKFLLGFDIADLQAGKYIVVTDIGCHSHHWGLEVAQVAMTFVVEPPRDVSGYTPAMFRLAFQNRRAAHCRLLKALVGYGNHVIWVADPPFVKTNLDAAETVLIDLVKSSGVRDVIRPRNLVFDSARSVIGDRELIHGNEYYYGIVAEEVRRKIDRR